jgi:pimeloyl-ACP methyl ester carboxylesterase
VREPQELVALPSGSVLHIEGPADADPVLFLHGAAGGAWSWRPQRDAFAPAWRVCVWEARGHGAAARVADAGLADYYVDAHEALAGVIDLVRRPAFVVGHSLGGLLALALACNVGAAVRGLFLIDPVYVTRNGRGIVPPALASVARALGAPLTGSIARNGALGRAFVRWTFTTMFTDRARMEAAWSDQRAQIPAEYPRILREAVGGVEGSLLRDFAAEISEPAVLLASSNYGRLGDPAFVATLSGRLGQHFRFERVAGGHYLQLDRPAVVNEHLRSFLETYGLSQAL